ncbi:MAG: twin-arginine translocation signal domain-containing protein [Pseudoruegeria sp.]
MTQKDKEATSRRDFLKLAGTAVPAAAATVLATGQEAEAANAPDSQATALQDTAHTRAYFDSARF